MHCALPNGWKWTPFAEAFDDVSRLGGKVQQDDYKPHGRYPVVDQSKSDIAGYTDDDSLLFRGELPAIVFGDHTRAVKYVDFPFVRGADGTRLLKPTLELDPEYAYYYLRSIKLKELGYSRHFKLLKEIVVPIAPLAEQRRIVDILKRADGIRRLRKQAIRTARELIPALFVDMFGEQELPVLPLGSVAEVVSGVTKGRRFNGKKTVVVPYLRVANVQAGHLDLSEIKTVEVLPSDVEKLALQKGDVLLTEGGDYDKLGRGALWDHEIENCIHQNHIFRVRADRSRLDPVYFTNFLQTQAARLYFLKSAKRTTNLASINMTQLRNLPVQIPLLSDQAEFVARANDVKSIERQQEAAELREGHLFESVLHRAFRGEL